MNISMVDTSFSWPGASTPLFSGCSLTIRSGSTSALLGPNGVGKTTLMEVILGWRKPAEGHVLVNGTDVGRMPPRERGKTMALVPQNEQMPFAYSALEYVMLGRAAHLPPLSAPGTRDHDIGMNALEAVGIPQLAGRSVTRLSGGELRLVLIARALAQEPSIMLLDEPTNHLDPANREKILGILNNLNAKGITLIISSHEPDLVLRLADEVVLMKAGSAPESGPVMDLMTPEKLEQVYGVSARIVDVEDRRLILWGS